MGGKPMRHQSENAKTLTGLWMSDIEQAIGSVSNAIIESKGNVTQAAASLMVSLSTLKNWIADQPRLQAVLLKARNDRRRANSERRALIPRSR
jgi:hypothetical protein